MKVLLLALLFCGSLFATNVDFTERAKSEGWTFHFTDKPVKYKTGFLSFPKVSQNLDYQTPGEDLPIPAEYDLRNKITQIEDQGQCGSCWAFSLTATLRDVWTLYGKDPGRLSQQYLVDCGHELGCNGGTFDAATYFVTPKGAPSWDSYPYVARTQRCKASTPTAGIIGWHYVGSESSVPTVKQIQQAILSSGPVSVTVGADNAFAQYESGIYNACSNQQVNHMVNIVGWSDTGKYWIMRNSWGPKWGENGWMRIAYTGRTGRPCNNIGNQAAFYTINDKPLPPVPVTDFSVEGTTIGVKGSLKPAAKYQAEEAKKEIQDVVDSLDKK